MALPTHPHMRRVIMALLYVVVVFLIPLGLKGLQAGNLITPSTYTTNMDILIKAAYFAIAALGLNIIVGYCGLLNLGFAGFMLIGAYTYAILTDAARMEQLFGLKFALPFWGAWIAAVAHGAFWGVVLGMPTLRLTGDYFAIVTFGFGELVNMVAKNWASITRGSRGYPGLPRPSFGALPVEFGSTFKTIHNYWFLVGALLGLVMLVSGRLLRSRMGR